MGIQSTTDYDKFKLIRGNRELIPGHVARLTGHILKKNMLPQNPIIVNEKFEVIDGQHRLEVARNNELEIFYIVMPGATFSEIISLNTNNRVWNNRDYIHAYASQGKPDYVWLTQFMDEFGISVTECMFFLFGGDATSQRIAMKNGRLELSDAQKQRATERAELLWSVRPFIKRSGFVPRAFLIEIIHVYDEGNADRLVKGVKSKAATFSPEANRKDAYEQLHLLMA